MPKYRNITDRTLYADVGGGRLTRVGPDEVVDVVDDGRYWQTGETGEAPIWVRVDGKKSTTKPDRAEDKE